MQLPYASWTNLLYTTKSLFLIVLFFKKYTALLIDKNHQVLTNKKIRWSYGTTFVTRLLLHLEYSIAKSKIAPPLVGY